MSFKENERECVANIVNRSAKYIYYGMGTLHLHGCSCYGAAQVATMKKIMEHDDAMNFQLQAIAARPVQLYTDDQNHYFAYSITYISLFLHQ